MRRLQRAGQALHHHGGANNDLQGDDAEYDRGSGSP